MSKLGTKPKDLLNKRIVMITEPIGNVVEVIVDQISPEEKFIHVHTAGNHCIPDSRWIKTPNMADVEILGNN